MQQTLIIASYFSQINNILGGAPSTSNSLQTGIANPLINPLGSLFGGSISGNAGVAGLQMMGGASDFGSILGMGSNLGGNMSQSQTDLMIS